MFARSTKEINMKSNEFIRKTHHKGTFAGVHFDEESKDALMDFIKENNIPNAPERDSMHTTLLYSRRRCPDYEAAGKIDPPYVGTPTDYQIWESQEDEDGDKTNCLILEFKCQELVDRHNSLMEEHNATFDFPTYKTHITLSYDVGDMQTEVLPEYTGPLRMVEEYGEVLDVDWAKNNTE